eukprot:9807199-Karenia_brevis.AAC.1
MRMLVVIARLGTGRLWKGLRWRAVCGTVSLRSTKLAPRMGRCPENVDEDRSSGVRKALERIVVEG